MEGGERASVEMFFGLASRGIWDVNGCAGADATAVDMVTMPVRWHATVEHSCRVIYCRGCKERKHDRMFKIRGSVKLSRYQHGLRRTEVLVMRLLSRGLLQDSTSLRLSVVIEVGHAGSVKDFCERVV